MLRARACRGELPRARGLVRVECGSRVAYSRTGVVTPGLSWFGSAFARYLVLFAAADGVVGKVLANKGESLAVDQPIVEFE